MVPAWNGLPEVMLMVIYSVLSGPTTWAQTPVLPSPTPKPEYQLFNLFGLQHLKETTEVPILERGCEHTS